MSYGLGVHLGTTSVVAAAAQGPRAEMISLGERGVVAGAAVYLRADGTMIAGDLAVSRHHLHPDRVVREVRRRLGDPTPIMIGNTAHTPPVLLARMLSDVVAKATVARGSPPDHVVLTHPASWGPFRRELFDDVPRLAGLSAARMVTEAVAAAVHYDASARFADGAAVAVFHMGGGTCEVTVLRKSHDDFDILGTPESIERLGGADIDEAILGYVDRATNGALAELDVDDSAIATTLARLHRDCVLAKVALSVKTDTVVPVFLLDRQVQIPLTRPTLEGLIRPLLGAPMTALRRALASAGIAPNDLSGVCLTGGSTRIPLVGRTISDVLGCPVLVDTHPQFVVALGAARLATPSRRATPLYAGEAVCSARSGTDPGRPVSGGAEQSAVRIAVIAVLATLLLVAATVAALIIVLHAQGIIGEHKTSTFFPTLAPTSVLTAGHG